MRASLVGIAKWTKTVLGHVCCNWGNLKRIKVTVLFFTAKEALWFVCTAKLHHHYWKPAYTIVKWPTVCFWRQSWRRDTQLQRRRQLLPDKWKILLMRSLQSLWCCLVSHHMVVQLFINEEFKKNDWTDKCTELCMHVDIQVEPL